MARFFGIEQYNVKKPFYYYHVFTEDLGGVDFYIEIDSENKIVSIYKDSDCSIYACSIDFNKLDEPINCSNKGLNEIAIPYLFTPIHKAFQKNEFPKYLSRYF